MSKKILFKNIASLGIVQIANYVLPLISIPIISRIIGPENFGIINYAAAFIAYFNILITYGFDLTATRKIARDPHNQNVRNAVFSEVFYAQLLLFFASILLFMACLFFVPLLNSEKEVAIFSFLFCLGTLFTQNWLFLAMQDLPKVALFDFISKLLFTIVVISIVQEKEDYVWQPLIASIVQVIVATISFTWAIKRYKIKFIKVKFVQILQLLKKEGAVFFALILINVYTTANVIILGIFQSPEKVGYYTAGQKLIVVASSVVILPLSHALFPFIGRAFGESYNKGILVVQKLIPIVVLLTGTMGVIMLILGPWAIRIFYGVQFEPTILVFQLLVFIPMLVALGNIFGMQLMLNLGMDKLYLRITVATAIISISSNFILVTVLGHIGAAYNWLLTEIFLIIVMISFLRIKGIMPVDFRQFHPKYLSYHFVPFVKKIFKKGND